MVISHRFARNIQHGIKAILWMHNLFSGVISLLPKGQLQHLRKMRNRRKKRQGQEEDV